MLRHAPGPHATEEQVLMIGWEDFMTSEGHAFQLQGHNTDLAVRFIDAFK